MRSLTINAASADSARAMAAALGEFHPRLVRANGHHDVVVMFGDGDREIVRFLSALARYAAEQAEDERRDASRV